MSNIEKMAFFYMFGLLGSMLTEVASFSIDFHKILRIQARPTLIHFFDFKIEYFAIRFVATKHISSKDPQSL